MKKVLLTIIFTLSLIGFSAVTYAADSSHCDAPDVIGGDDYCPSEPSEQDYWSGSCHDRVTCNPGYTFNCSQGKCCYDSDDGTHDNYADGLSCTAIHRSYNGCTETCGSCTTGFTEIGDVCVADCGSGTYYGTLGACVDVADTEERVALLEGVESCWFNGSGQYIKAEPDVLCDDPYDDSTITNNISGLTEAAQLLADAVSAITGEPNISLWISELLGGDSSNVGSLQDLIDNLVALGVAVDPSSINTDGATEDQVITNVGGTAVWADPAVGGATAEPNFVGVSGSTKNGVQGGYASVDLAECGVGNHVCTAEEILYAYRVGDPDLPTTGDAWYNSGAPTNPDMIVNDCNGWNTADSGIGATIWDFGNSKALMSPCNQFHKFACCN